MSKKAKAKKSTVATDAHTKAIKENISALTRHTAELKRHSKALVMSTAITTAGNAKQIVYSVLNEPLTLSDQTPLSKLGLDFEALSYTAVLIRNHGVSVATGLVQACKKIADLVKVVAAAMK